MSAYGENNLLKVRLCTYYTCKVSGGDLIKIDKKVVLIDKHCETSLQLNFYRRKYKKPYAETKNLLILV